MSCGIEAHNDSGSNNIIFHFYIAEKETIPYSANSSSINLLYIQQSGYGLAAEGRGVRLCWAHSKPQGPKGPRSPPTCASDHYLIVIDPGPQKQNP